ncbi:MAG: hypothetical protein H6833_11775 [Planctomycetes bacterium]|nr:hypothetical protein [Planctomycetota bacterium]
MNSRERMRIAMTQGIPDRVPLMCQLSLGHDFLHANSPPYEIWHDSQAFAEALVTLQRRYGFDGILVNLPGRDPNWREHIDHIEHATSDADPTRIRWRNGLVTEVPPDDSPHVLTSAGERVFPTFDELDPGALHYVEPHDLFGVRYPTSWSASGEPASIGSGFFPPWQTDTLRRVIELTKGEVSVHAEVFSPFSQLMELLDFTQGLMALLLDEAKVLAILERLAEGAIHLGHLYAETGCDALLISSAFVGAGFISRSHYETFELPFVQRVVEGVHATFPELPIYLHTCGAIGDRLDLMERTGVDGIDTFDPPPIGTVTLQQAIDTLGKRVFIKGNLDPVNTLLEGSIDDVRAAARERLHIGAPGGAYILSTACSIPPHTPPENVAVLHEVVREFAYHA